MDLGLTNKVAVVTGASKGIGKAIANRFAAEGAQVVICARGENDLVQTAKKIQAEHTVDVLPVPADVTKSEDVETVVDKTIRHFNRLHILVNNAGKIGKFASFDELSDTDWRDVFEVNLVAAVRITRAVLPYMEEMEWGRIINIASESGLQPDPEIPHYNATKAAIINLTKSLSKAYAEDGILVNAISPATTRTPVNEFMLDDLVEEMDVDKDEAIEIFLQKKRPNILLKRLGQPEEIANIAALLGSEAASFVTGSNYRVDGGSVASLP